MTFLWLLAWLLSESPHVEILHSWNDWGIALAVCIAIDVLGAISRRNDFWDD
jgi:hypothetical protein